MRSLPELAAQAASRFGPRPALAVRRGLRTEVWSYADLASAVPVAGARLQAAGLQPGERVLMLAPNSPELAISMFGVWQAGGVLVPIDLRTSPEVLQRIRALSEPRLLIAEGPAEGLEDLPRLSPAEVAPRPGERPATTGPSEPAARSGEVPDLAEIVFTSGTTGAPKGAMLTHANILSNVRSSLDAIPIEPGTRVLSILPLSHMLEQTVGLFSALAAGTTIYYTTSRRSSALLAALQRHRIQLLVCVPEVLRLLLAGLEREVERTARRRLWERLLAVADRLPLALRPLLFAPVHRRLGGCLRLVQCGGAPLEAELWRTWERLGVRVVEGYGATECAPVVTSNRLHRRLPASVGWPVREVEVRLADDGEVLVRGPNVMPGYWRDPAATAASLDGGWYHTGDIGSFGSQGELRLLGRKKEMIVLSSGRNVFPQDVEDAIRLDPAIRECAVVGLPRSDGRVEVHAAVVPSGEPEAALAAVRRANARLSSHQQVGGVTIWPEPDLPRTSSLKVKRLAVLEALQRQGSSARPAPPAPPREDFAGQVTALVAQAAGRSPTEVRPESDLVLDLGLDSLGLVELAVLLEEQLGRTLADEEMAAQRTVGDLVAALEHAATSVAAEPLPAWPRQRPVRLARALIQNLAVFPVLRRLYRPLKIRGAERLAGLRGPVLIVANHTSHLDALTVLSILPAARRRRTAVAAAADYFFASRPLALISGLVLGAFPFHRRGPVSASLAHCGDLADAGLSILIFPEGTRSPDGSLQPFKAGIGLLARELGLPVLPIHLAGLHAILPKGRSRPRPGPVSIKVGEPIVVSPGLSNAQAAALLEAAVQRLAP